MQSFWEALDDPEVVSALNRNKKVTKRNKAINERRRATRRIKRKATTAGVLAVCIHANKAIKETIEKS